jgi:hypothetical protein
VGVSSIGIISEGDIPIDVETGRTAHEYSLSRGKYELLVMRQEKPPMEKKKKGAVT